MDSKLKNYKEITISECEKTNINTPFSINDILTKEHESKCDYEANFGAKINFLAKSSGCFEKNGIKKEHMEKGMKFYDDCNGYREYNEDGVLDMSRKNSYPVTELSGKCIYIYLEITKIVSYGPYVDHLGVPRLLFFTNG